MPLTLSAALLSCSALGLCLAAGGAAAQDGTPVELRQDPALGPFLVDSSGMSLYLFEADTAGASTCFDDCMAAWPPLVTDGPAVAGTGVDQALLGTTERPDGLTQVTYGGWPLYYYVEDTAPGETRGHDFEDFGAEWYLVSPTGETVEDEGGERSEGGGRGEQGEGGEGGGERGEDGERGGG